MVVLTEDAGPLLPRFYAGRSLLITGATGFVGKVLVERVLATCPDVARLHVLLRDKRGHAPLKRLAQLKHSQVFDVIREGCPEQLDKLSAVAGDITQPHFGLDDKTISELREVSVVLHCAATVKLDPSLAVAAHQNVGSVLALLEVCDRLPNLQALVHVSTAYSNSERALVEERVYPSPMDPAHLLALVQALPTDVLDDITPRLVHPKPNTYTFTKAIAESIVQQKQQRHYSVSICRPSVVVSAHRHPYPGWVEGLSGAVGFVVGVGQGLVHIFQSVGRARADVVPVDIVADTLMAVCWETASHMSGEVRVYNFSSQENPTRWRDLALASVAALRAHPFDRALWYPFLLSLDNRYLHFILEFLLQTAPLYTAEYISKLCGFKSKLSLITMSQRIRALNAVLNYFVRNEWRFAIDNVRLLRERLTPRDRAIYNLDIKTVKWDEHYVNMAKGARKYLLQQKEDKMDDARRHMDRLRLIHYMVILIILVLSYKFLSAVVHSNL